MSLQASTTQIITAHTSSSQTSQTDRYSCPVCPDAKSLTY